MVNDEENNELVRYNYSPGAKDVKTIVKTDASVSEKIVLSGTADIGTLYQVSKKGAQSSVGYVTNAETLDAEWHEVGSTERVVPEPLVAEVIERVIYTSTAQAAEVETLARRADRGQKFILATAVAAICIAAEMTAVGQAASAGVVMVALLSGPSIAYLSGRQLQSAPAPVVATLEQKAEVARFKADAKLHKAMTRAKIRAVKRSGRSGAKA